MPEIVWGVWVVVWFVEALVIGFVMGRRGYEAYGWTILGAVFGPLILPLVITFFFRPPVREPKPLRAGHLGEGPVDVLVGVDGSVESSAAVARAISLFGSVAGRVTLARVVPMDATIETERRAEAELEMACSDHPASDPSTVLLRGEPVAALSEHARRHDYDVLVAGTRGLGRSKALLGSVAVGLARGAGIPVLLVDADREPSALLAKLRSGPAELSSTEIAAATPSAEGAS